MSANFRVTERSISQSSLANLQVNLNKLSNLQAQLSSNRKLNKPSDSPGGTVDAMQLKASMRSNDQYVRNAADGSSWLGSADNTLQSMVSVVQKVRGLALQGMSTGNNGTPAAQQALSSQVSSLHDELLSSANTTYLNRPLFGGTTAGTAAYDTTGAYIGDNGAVTRTVGPNSSVQVNVTGPETFGSGSGQLFAVVSDIADHMTSNPALLGADMDRLDAVMTNMTNKLSTIGARENRVSDASQTATTAKNTLAQNLSAVQDIDLPTTIVNLQMQETAYQSALAATAKAITPSLVDFLK